MPPYVLLIDDDPDSLAITRMMLEFAGLPVKTAASGRDGLTVALNDPPAVAIIDLNMPRLSGLEVLRVLRQEPAVSRVATIALTGVPELLDGVSDVRFDSVLTKPAEQAELVRVVRALMGTASA